MNLNAVYQQICSAGNFKIDDAGNFREVPTQQFALLVRQCMSRLADAGVAPGSRVVFQGEQGLAALTSFWATVLMGGIFVPIDASWPEYLLLRACAKIEPAIALVDDRLASLWRSAFPQLTVAVNSDQDMVAGFADADLASVPDQVENPPSTPAAYLFTSGSTGDPKAVVLSHEALARSAVLVVQTFRWQPGERLVNLPEPHTMSGLRNPFVAAPLAGMCWVCLPPVRRANAFALLSEIERLRPQHLVAAPLLLRHVNLLGTRVEKRVFASLLAVFCTGTDLHLTEVQRFHARFGIPVVNYYGLTETTGLCLSQDVSDWSADDASIGRPVGCAVRLVDGSGREVGDGAVGELQVRLPCAMNGYLNDPDATGTMLDGDWIRTGDLARCCADGRFIIVGRIGNFINTLGTDKIYPQEIEALLEQLPAIAEAAVFGLPDAAGGERIAALVVPRIDAAADDISDHRLADFIRARLGPSRVPRRIPHGSIDSAQRQLKNPAQPAEGCF